MTKTLPFDRTFMLTTARSLNSPHSRTAITLDHLRAEGIEVEPFLSMDGQISGLQTIHTYDIDHPGTNYRIGPKTISMFIGHLMMWKVCQYISGESFLFLEDDVRFKPDWREHFNFAMPALPADWDLLYIGSCCCQDKNPQRVSGHLHRVSYALCTHAYALSRKALPVIEQACQKVYAGIDIAMCLHGIPQLQAYAFLPRLADQFETVIPN